MHVEIFEALMSGFRGQSVGLLRDLLEFTSSIREVRIRLLPVVIEQVSISNSFRWRSIEGSKAPMHKFLEGKRSTKLRELVRWCIKVQKNLECGMGGTKVSRDNLEAFDQRQSKSVGENLVPARGLVRPCCEAGRNIILPTPSSSNSSKVCPPMRRQRDNNLVDVLRISVKINSEQRRTRVAQEMVLQYGTNNVACLSSFSIACAAPGMPIGIITI